MRSRPSHRPGPQVAALVAVVALALTGLVALPSGAAPAPVAAGAAPTPGFGEPGTPVRPASERYVREAYRAVLGRGADEPGLTYWGGRLDSGTSRGTFARQLLLAREPLLTRIDDIYGVLNGSPNPAEKAAALAALRSGTATPESLRIDVLSSITYRLQHGLTTESYVRALYQDVLGRTGSDADVAFWVDVILGGSDTSARVRFVAYAFVVSFERLRPVVDDAYDRLLARSADGPGRDHWVTRIRRGTSSIEVETNLLASGEAWSMGYSILDSTRCLLPFPNDQLTLPDASTDTGRRVVLKSPWVPAPAEGPAFDPTEWNRQDGFSPGSALLTASNGIDPAQSGLPPLTDIAASLAPDSPIVVVDADTGERWPVWAELDANAPSDAERALFIRPARNFLDGHTYTVGIGEVRNAAGAVIPAPGGFRIFRDDLPQPSRRVREQAPAVDAAIDDAVTAGLDRASMYLAWSFTVASTRNLAERAVHMRDEVLGGTAGAVAAPFTVISSTPRDDGTTRIDGTFQIPNYLTGDGAPGSRLNLGADDLPEPNGSLTAPFTCTLPDSATAASPARPSLYGHGLLGTGGQANSGYVRIFATEHNVALCGTDYIGMADQDLPNTVGILGDLSRFPELVDRNQQALLDTLVLGRLMTRPDGLVSDPAFQGEGGAPRIDAPGGELFYYGNSQGGINGGAIVALSPDIRRGVLGVPGMNYSTLLQRSVDFDPFFTFLAAKYPSALDRTLMLSAIQMLWDRGEANGYANHMTADPLPGSGTSEVLLHVAFGDHQVAQITADVMARTYGAATVDPPLAPGRVADVTPLWGIDRISTWPHAGSALVYWDSGTAAPPIENLPNRAGEDPHGDPRNDPDARIQMDDFLQPGGVVTDQCGGSWCLADPS